MFRKTLAAATTLLLAGALSLGAMAAPAFADGSDPSTTTDPTTSSAPAPDPTSSDPAPDPTSSDPAPDPASSDPAPAPSDSSAPDPSASDSTPPPAADSAPVSAPASQLLARTTQQNPPALRCIPTKGPVLKSAVSFTYDRYTNSGTITIVNPDSSKYLPVLCHPFYVLAAGWLYTTTDTWPQDLAGTAAALDGAPISAVGSYDYGFAVTCGQGDVYASWKSPVPAPPETLLGSNTGYDEVFLSDLGFTNLNIDATWTATDPSCHVTPYPVRPSVTAKATCDAPGQISRTDTDQVTYALTDGDGKTGTNKVTATAQGNWIFPNNKTTQVFTLDLGTPTGCLVVPGDPSSSPAVCVDGSTGNGGITVVPHDGLVYTLTDPNGVTVPITQATTSVLPGTYTVHVAAIEPGFTMGDSAVEPWKLVGDNSWEADVTVDPPVDCDPPTLADFSLEVSSTPAACTAGTGTITAGPAEFAGFVNFFIDGKAVTPGSAVKVAVGDHVVSGTPVDPADTVDNSPIPVTIHASGAVCPTELKTLALTGTDPSAPLLAAGVLLPAGALLLLGAALIRRRREQ